MPAWMTPELWPVWPVPTSSAASTTATRRPGRSASSSRRRARAAMPRPTVARAACPRPDDGEVVALHAGRVVVASGAAAVAWSVVQVLVTGASGAIGAELVPRLVRGGHGVRPSARAPSRVPARGIERVVRGGAVRGAGLDEALDGIDVAYFLIHS